MKVLKGNNEWTEDDGNDRVEMEISKRQEISSRNLSSFIPVFMQITIEIHTTRLKFNPMEWFKHPFRTKIRNKNTNKRNLYFYLNEWRNNFYDIHWKEKTKVIRLTRPSFVLFRLFLEAIINCLCKFSFAKQMLLCINPLSKYDDCKN